MQQKRLIKTNNKDEQTENNLLSKTKILKEVKKNLNEGLKDFLIVILGTTVVATIVGTLTIIPTIKTYKQLIDWFPL